MIIGSVPSGDIIIVHGDQEAVDADGVRRRATARDDPQSQAVTALRNPLLICSMEPLPLMVPKDPLRQSIGRVLMTSDHVPFPIGSSAAAMIEFT